MSVFEELRCNGICQKEIVRESTVCPYLCFGNRLSTWPPLNVGRISCDCRSIQSNISGWLKVRVKKGSEASEEACMKAMFYVN